MTGLRTDGRTYGHDVITKFSELHGLLPFSLTNGAPQAAFGPWSSAINLLEGNIEFEFLDEAIQRASVLS